MNFSNIKLIFYQYIFFYFLIFYDIMIKEENYEDYRINRDTI